MRLGLVLALGIVLAALGAGTVISQRAPPSDGVERVLPTGDGTATLTWKAPTKSTDGAPLNEISGYVIRYGLSRTELTEIVYVPGGNATSYTVTGLGKGVWYFAVAAYVTVGNESELSKTVSKRIQ